MANRFSWQMMTAIGLALMAGLLLGRYVGLSAKPTKDSPQANAPQAVMTVEAISPSLKTIDDSIDANGVIVAKDIAKVGARASGVAIEQLYVQEGDVVQVGQLLARLDDTVATNQGEAMAAELTQAQFAFAKAQADLARVEPLVAIDAISRQQYDGFVTAKEQAAAQVTALQARLDSAQTAQQNTQVRSPVAGVVSTRFAQVGELTTGAPLFEIVKDGVWQWQASVAPDLATQIAIGQPAELVIPNSKKTVPAVVTRIAPTADANRHLNVFATLGDDSPLVGGMYVTGRFLFAQQSVVTVPYQAVTLSDGFGYVWVLTPENNGLYQANRRQVSASPIGDSVVVDLPLNTLLVKEGGNFLKDGDWVRVVGTDSTVGGN